MKKKTDIIPFDTENFFVPPDAGRNAGAAFTVHPEKGLLHDRLARKKH